MIKIGYQGEMGSNSEAVAEIYTKEKNYKMGEYSLIPLVESTRVINALKSGEIDYGIVAVRNSEAGLVEETCRAMAGKEFVCVKKIVLPIHHCIFIKPDADVKDIRFVTSHIQALNQTRKNRSIRFPDWAEEETNDTAAAARYLSEGILPGDHAVICRKNAGEKYGLKLLYENIEDSPDNRTEFSVLKMPYADGLFGGYQTSESIAKLIEQLMREEK